MTNFQIACLLVFTLYGYIIVSDELAAAIVANFHLLIDRFIFARWYLICTHPRVLAYHAIAMPKRSELFYYRLSCKLFKKFPELTDWTD